MQWWRCRQGVPAVAAVAAFPAVGCCRSLIVAACASIDMELPRTKRRRCSSDPGTFMSSTATNLLPIARVVSAVASDRGSSGSDGIVDVGDGMADRVRRSIKLSLSTLRATAGERDAAACGSSGRTAPETQATTRKRESAEGTVAASGPAECASALAAAMEQRTTVTSKAAAESLGVSNRSKQFIALNVKQDVTMELPDVEVAEISSHGIVAKLTEQAALQAKPAAARPSLQAKPDTLIPAAPQMKSNNAKPEAAGRSVIQIKRTLAKSSGTVIIKTPTQVKPQQEKSDAVKGAQPMLKAKCDAARVPMAHGSSPRKQQVKRIIVVPSPPATASHITTKESTMEHRSSKQLETMPSTHVTLSSHANPGPAKGSPEETQTKPNSGNKAATIQGAKSQHPPEVTLETLLPPETLEVAVKLEPLATTSALDAPTRSVTPSPTGNLDMLDKADVDEGTPTPPQVAPPNRERSKITEASLNEAWRKKTEPRASSSCMASGPPSPVMLPSGAPPTGLIATPPLLPFVSPSAHVLRGAPAPSAAASDTVQTEDDDDIASGQLPISAPAHLDEQQQLHQPQEERVQELNLELDELEIECEQGMEEGEVYQVQYDEKEVVYLESYEEPGEDAEGWSSRDESSDAFAGEEALESNDSEDDYERDEDFESYTSSSEEEEYEEVRKATRKRPAASRRSLGTTKRSRCPKGRSDRSRSEKAAKRHLAAIMAKASDCPYTGELRDLIPQPALIPAVPLPSYEAMVALLVFAASTMSCASSADDSEDANNELYDFIFSHALEHSITSMKRALAHLRVWFDAVFGPGGQCYEYLDPVNEHPIVQANDDVPTLLVANQYPGDAWRYQYTLRTQNDIGYALGNMLLLPFFTSRHCIHVLLAGPLGGKGIELSRAPGITRVLSHGLSMWLSCRKGTEAIYNLTLVGLEDRASHSRTKGTSSNLTAPNCLETTADQRSLEQRYGALVPLSENAGFYYDLHPNENATWKERFAGADFAAINEKVGNKPLNLAMFLPVCATVPIKLTAEELFRLQCVTGSVFFSALDYFAATPAGTGGRCCFVFWGSRDQVRALHSACQILLRYQTVPENDQGVRCVPATSRIDRRFKLTLIDPTADGGTLPPQGGALSSDLTSIRSTKRDDREDRCKRKSNVSKPAKDGGGVTDLNMQFSSAQVRGKMHVLFYATQSVEVDGTTAPKELKLPKGTAAEPIFVFRVVDADVCTDQPNTTGLICPRSLANAVVAYSKTRYTEGLPLGLRYVSLLLRTAFEGSGGGAHALLWLASVFSEATVNSRSTNSSSRSRRGTEVISKGTTETAAGTASARAVSGVSGDWESTIGSPRRAVGE